jgi:hypothetical protein
MALNIPAAKRLIQLHLDRRLPDSGKISDGMCCRVLGLGKRMSCSSGGTLFTRADVMSVHAVFLSHGLMEYGANSSKTFPHFQGNLCGSGLITVKLEMTTSLLMVGRQSRQ